MAMMEYDVDMGGPKDYENVPYSFLIKTNGGDLTFFLLMFVQAAITFKSNLTVLKICV